MSNWIKINTNLILRFIGAMLMIFGAFMALCIPVALWYKDSNIFPLAISAMITSTTGLFLRIIAGKVTSNSISNRDAYLIVTFGWVAIALTGSLPYLLSGVITNFSSAVFESVSGLTTTGATVIRDVESVSKGILLWRSLSQWLGGMGFVMLIITLIPMLGTGGLNVMASDILDMTSEKPGRTFLKSIRWIWLVYTILTLIFAIVYKLLGMQSFDALCHAFSTISTGGFSTHNDNAAFFSPQVQYAMMFFMILSGANFPLLVKALSGKPLRLFKSQELRYYLFLILFISLIISAVLIFIQGVNIEIALREAFFQVISFISTTGYIVTDYTLWVSPLWLILFLLMLTGSCSGSSGGGLKVMRQLIMLKNTSNSIRNLVNPHAVYVVRIDKKIISEDVIYNVLAYYFIYLVVFAIGSFLITLTGSDFRTSIGIAASSIGNLGPGIGYEGPFPIYDNFSSTGKWLVSGLMLIGRLEFFAILILFTSSFWKK